MRLITENEITLNDLKQLLIANIHGDIYYIKEDDLEYHPQLLNIFKLLSINDDKTIFVAGAKIDEVYREGGGEGGAEQCFRVYSLTYPDGMVEYVEMSFLYYSHEGYLFDYAEIYEVEPREVVVTQYFRKQ